MAAVALPSFLVAIWVRTCSQNVTARDCPIFKASENSACVLAHKNTVERATMISPAKAVTE